MKYLIILLITFPVFACQNMVPTSEAQRYIDALPNGVPPLYSCADKPGEQCHCVDEIIWEQADFITEITQDDLGINIETKVLKNSEAKKAQRQAEKEAQKIIEDDKKAAKKAAKIKVKSFKFKGVTIKELRDELNDFANDSAKAQDE